MPINNLKDFLINEIKNNGYVTLDNFINHCLSHPLYGYYVNENVLGKKGDFITAPEVSQMFGEIISIFIVANFLANKSSIKAVSLLELGAGSGILMNDILRTFNVCKELVSKLSTINLLDINKNLKIKQKQTLTKHNFNLNLIENLKDTALAKDDSIIIIANEFFDALATKQFKFINGSFYEVVIKYSGKEFVQATLQEKAQIEETFLKNLTPKEGDILEISYSAIAKVKEVCSLLKKNGGLAIIIDYGYKENTLGNSVQAICQHKYSNFLSNVGKSDITFHVNFNHLKEFATKDGLTVSEIKTQGEFLQEIGILERYLKLSANKTQSEKKALAYDLQRLIGVNEMGNLFKVLILSYNIKNTVYI